MQEKQVAVTCRLLVASEVTGLKLNADWVLLSACNTGADNQESGTAGLGGLAKAFFYAGARTLMVSHWRVPSKATVELTTQTIAGSLDGGMGKAEAKI
jgi:CHAT domain-containing protein